MTDLREATAQSVHETIRSIQIANGEEPVPHWEDTEQWQRDSTYQSIDAALAGQTPRQQHETWMAAKISDGWKYGPVKDAAAKTHPLLVSYDNLSETDRRKDAALVGLTDGLLGPLDD